MSTDNNQESKPIQDAQGTTKNPFENVKPAEIPTKLHTFSYQGKKETRHNEKKN